MHKHDIPGHAGIDYASRAGSGYGGTVTLPTMRLVRGEITVVGNLIGTNPDLTDLIALAQQGKVALHSTRYVSIPK